MSFDISKYLEKFKILSQSKFFIRDFVVESIKNVCGIDIIPSKIEVKDFVVRINEKPIVKNQIFLKKTKILNDINSKINNKINDIL